ncbi:MAG: phosphohydrolase [Acidimicrobiia bacterium]|nr:MAG: phosphohydrolase [Acidimicrobiia bacterium]
MRPRDVDALLALLARGSARFDEPDLDVLAHSLQCAAILGREHPDDPELVAAGLVHDVADALPGGHGDHARRGAELVAGLLGARVARLVAAHVDAKRYLVATERSYADALSARSAQTLRDQGGPMTAAEAARFARDPDLDAILALRRADERAKRPGAVVPGLDHWRGVLEACCDRTGD